jgi:hypothetical protein
MIRVGRHLDRIVPNDIESQRESIVGFGVVRIRSSGGPARLHGGLRGVNEVVVLIPLQEWNVDNGLFCTARITTGQDICLGGLEEVVFPGSGGCLVLMLFLELPTLSSQGSHPRGMAR